MIFLTVLLLAYGGTWLVPRLRGDQRRQWRVGLGVAMAVAGLAHLAAPTPFVQHLPSWVPGREPLVLVTGVLELVLGIAVLARQPLRRRAGLALALYLVAVFPANIYVAVAGVEVDGQPGGLYPWLRLPWQVLFVWLALWTTRDRRSEPVRPAAVDGAAATPG